MRFVLTLIKFMNNYSDKILYGKSQQERIVSLEVKDNVCELYIQKDNGDVEVKFEKNKFWILTNEPFGYNKWVKLRGEQHYKYGLQFDSREEFIKFRYKNKDRDLYSIYDSREAVMVKDGYTYFKGLNFKDITTLSFDIETTGLNGKASDAFLILISTTLRKNGVITKKLFSYDEYTSEGKMIVKFADYIKKCDPSIIVGHNIITFDIPYILDRANYNNVLFEVGRDGSVPEVNEYESKFRIDGTRDLHYKNIRIYGREICDTLLLANKFDIAKKYESYGLKQIIKQEGLEKQDRVFYDASKIRENYKDKLEFSKIKQYAKDDADDALKLFDLMVAPFFYMNQMVPKTFQMMIQSASGSQINSLFVRSYLQDGHSVAKATEIKPFQGAISIGVSGIYKNCIRWDVAGMYPSIILENKLHDKIKDPNGYLYKITKYIKNERLIHKKLAKETNSEYNKAMDQTLKIFNNSIYGFTSAPGLNYNSPECAEFITNRGREILIKSIEWATGMKKDEITKLQNI